MAYDSKQAVKQLKDKTDELDATSTNTGVRLQNAHMYTNSLMALSQAVGCRLEAMAWGMVLVGLGQRDAEDMARRFIEDDKARERYQDVRVELMELTQDLVSQALAQNCDCHNSEVPAPLLGE